MALNRTYQLLNSGAQIIPALGLGTWKAQPNEVAEAVKHAVKIGYRHLDCAYIYENEKEIGEALRGIFASGIPRSSLFITSKLWNTFHRPEDVARAIDITLSDLGLQSLDLYLVHWPLAFKNRGDGNSEKDAAGKTVFDTVPIIDTWRAMEALVDAGKVKAIGVSNFNITKLKALLSEARIKPAVNQVELHPYLPQDELLEFCNKNGIHVTAYSPLGSGKEEPNLLKDEVVTDIAQRNGKSVAQVLISWAIQRGTSVIPKSSNPKRLEENFNDFVLSTKDFDALSARHKTIQARLVDPQGFWGVDVFAEGQ
ncbi:hypothetical protein HDU67_000588 [Dinochytrium kinnereticum]|nr:hypothetical protein HDU67_000588 [Dinochytrium kinnereticum]